FSDASRPAQKTINETHPAIDFLKLRRELIILQRRIDQIESTHGERDKLPDLRKQAQALESKLADAPPDPILPPSAPLVKVTGVLEEFHWRRVLYYFDPEAYPQTHGYFTRQQERVAKAAVVVAAAGQGAAAQGMVAGGNRLKTCAWYVTGKINGKRFSGWLGRCFCKPGEVVELVVAQAGDEYLVYALAKPEERSISMTPCSYRGKRQARWKGSWFWLGILFFAVFLILCTAVFQDGLKMLLNLSLYETIFMGFGIGGSVILGPALYSVWRRHPFPQEDLAEEIFTVMGWKNVTDINLGKLNRRRKRQWKRTGIPTNPFRDQTPFSYTGWGRWFYYY
ncbi:putative type VI secretion system effector, partial [Scandinavium goeteborgense]